MRISKHDKIAYPSSLHRLENPPDITVSGPLDREGRRVIAIVGARIATAEARGFAFQLAYHLAAANVIVVSGGAVGVDRAAHDGAMRAAGGSTWVVACTGRGEVFPDDHDKFFEHVEASSLSRMIWPFDDGTKKTEKTPRLRNRVLVGLAECVVVIQARLDSGSRNAAASARQIRRPIYVVPSTPWDEKFTGSIEEGIGGAEPLWSIQHFFDKLGLPEPDLDDPRALWDGKLPRKTRIGRKRRGLQTFGEAPLFAVDATTWTSQEKLVFSKLSMAPLQQDSIIQQTGLGASSTLTALLTLSLKDVVVEGPDGFFRRRIAL